MLRPYQAEACGKVLAEITNGAHRILLVMCTGAGKSIVCANIVKRIARRALVLCDREEIFGQLLGAMESEGVFAGAERGESETILDSEDDLFSTAPDVVVSTFQTMARRAAKFPVGYFDTIVTDEAHTVITDSRLALLKALGPKKIIGLTGTGFRADLRSMGELFDCLAFEYPLFQAVRDGWLVPLMSQTIPINPNLNSVKSVDGDLDEKDLHAAIRPHFHEAAKCLLEYAANRKTIAFFPLIDTSKEFVVECRKLGIRAEHVDGYSKNRSELIEKLNTGKIQLLCNAALFSYGTDIPGADCILLMRPTKSTVLFHQMVGRVVRTLKGTVDGIESAVGRRDAIKASAKPNALILDPVWMRDKHDLIKSARLVCQAADHAEAVQKILEENKGKPQDIEQVAQYALNDVLIQREANLRREMEKNKHKGARLVNALEFAVTTKNEKLSDPQSVMPWGNDAPTEKQLAALGKFGFDPMSIRNKGHASQLLDAAIGRSKNDLATPKQLKFLIQHKYPNPEKATYKEAGAFMDKKISRFKQMAYWKKARGRK